MDFDYCTAVSRGGEAEWDPGAAPAARRRGNPESSVRNAECRIASST